MPSLRFLTLLTAALSATAHAANTITIVNQCSYAVSIDELRGSSAISTSALAVGATSAAFEYNDSALHLRAYTDSSIDYLAFEALINLNEVYYDFLESVGGSAIGNDFVLTTSSADCPGVDGADVNITPTDENSTYMCAPGTAFTWTLCG
ncbi:uncharacterized protein J3D65DRAFT_599686 [Phyllosticta citribraziliensis]|uniref:Uncharacterized protein n=1 Tax=Phyllosticta citribraziliensis TaxID=989973 RepID=A0ABR1MB70_9PEZI